MGVKRNRTEKSARMSAVARKVLEFAREIDADWYKAVRLPNAGLGGSVRQYFAPTVWEQGGRNVKVASDWRTTALDSCYFCKKKYRDYAAEYKADGGDDGCFVYAAKCGVCEECAAERAKKARWVQYPYITGRYFRRENGKDIAVHEYSDGCVTEGVTQDDVRVIEE